MKIEENVALSKILTMRLGGPARWLARVKNREDLALALEFARERKLPIYVLGLGANVLARDEGFWGLVIKMETKGVKILEEGEELVIEAEAGEIWDELVKMVCEKGFSGIEALSGIPSTVGAAPVQNIGAYGQEIKDCLMEVLVLDIKTNKMIWLKKDRLEFGYRKSIFNSGKMAGRYIILAVRLKLKKTEIKRPFYISLEKFIEETGWSDFSPLGIRGMVLKVRGSKLPDIKKQASSGSFFKNVRLTKPEAKIAQAKGLMVWEKDYGFIIPSGWLIDQAGLAGQLIDGMRVSEKAALVLINESAKSYNDLAQARAKIREVVREKFGYLLEQEPVEIVGVATWNKEAANAD